MHPLKGERTVAQHGASICRLGAICLCIATACSAQAAQTAGVAGGSALLPVAGTSKHPARKHPATEHKHAELTDKTTKPSFPTDAAPRPATVNLSNGKLTVEANNSDLTQILHDLSEKSGMTIDGLHNGPRVFGTYGPGNSREILSALLLGSGYNFIMVGDAAQGAPRELLLTPQNGHAPAPAQLNSAPPANTDDEDSSPEETAPSMPDPPNPPDSPDAPGPGAIIPAPSPNNLDDATRMQQNLQRLQHMQEQQQPPPQ
jgi:hypothetical protein